MRRSDRFELVELPSGRWEVASIDYHATYRIQGATAVEALLALADRLDQDREDSEARAYAADVWGE